MLDILFIENPCSLNIIITTSKIPEELLPRCEKQQHIYSYNNSFLIFTLINSQPNVNS